MKTLNVEGTVLRETKVGERDKILTVFTRQLGKISVSAPGSRGIKSKFTAAAVPSYSNFTLMCISHGYRLLECAGIHSFGNIAYDFELLSYNVYFAEIIAMGEQENSPNEPLLRLYLNTLYLLNEKRRAPRFIKAVFEMKACCLFGFAPDLSQCGHCGSKMHEHYFSGNKNTFLCSKCKSVEEKIPPGAVSAIQYIVNSESDKVFSFTLSENAAGEFYRICEAYLIYNLEYPPKSLNYLYKNLT